MFPIVSGVAQNQVIAVNTNLYNLASVKSIHETSASDGVGINFNAGAANSGWMTGFQIVGTDGYVSNRGNNNAHDNTQVFITKIAMSSTGNGAVVRQNAAGLGLNSCDGFALNDDASKILLADFHGGSVRSATMSDNGSNLVITLNGSARSVQVGTRFVRWNNDGSKYYAGLGIGNNQSKLFQFSAGTNYIVASGDSQDKTLTFGWEAVSDMIFNSDGTKMYLSQHTGFVYQYELSTAYDIGSSLSANPVIFDLRDFQHYQSGSTNSPWRAANTSSIPPWLSGISWNSDGSKLYAITLWGTTKQSTVTGTVNPANVTGEGGSRTNTMPIIEFRVQ